MYLVSMNFNFCIHVKQGYFKQLLLQNAGNLTSKLIFYAIKCTPNQAYRCQTENVGRKNDPANSHLYLLRTNMRVLYYSIYTILTYTHLTN